MAGRYATLITICLLTLFLTCDARRKYDLCDSHPSCGNITDISYPFRLRGQPENCGEPLYELSCENNSTVLYLNNIHKKYVVQAIDRVSRSIRVFDPNVTKKNNCSFLALQPQSQSNNESFPYWSISFIIALSCDYPVNSNGYINITSCNTDTIKNYSYALVDPSLSDVEDRCTVDKIIQTVYLPCSFDLSWDEFYCHECKGKLCYFSSSDITKVSCIDSYGFEEILFGFEVLTGYSIVLFMLPKCICGSPFVAAFLIYKWRRRHLSMYDNIEDFLQNQHNLVPINYSSYQIKKMTKGFKIKLGQGGFGSVYKGKLRSGRAAAVKVLVKSKANGQDFINEVATIGRIHHVNVVQLVGFCANRSMRALVYDFMPNGSLEKYLFSKETDNHINLSYETMYNVSLGVARGIEYLHRGCEIQILHFDIKPHNILLDENFVPKLSDFGLAKLYPTENSIVTLTAARGTMGYMAPELFYKNIGGISYKADVYSFGMLLMEMAGRRKNLNAYAEHSSQIYFPSWAYDQIKNENEIELEELATEEDKKLVKKMMTTALWCIQMKPNDRPSMHKVVDMLQGDILNIPIPPKPFLTPREAAEKND